MKTTVSQKLSNGLFCRVTDSPNTGKVLAVEKSLREY